MVKLTFRPWNEFFQPQSFNVPDKQDYLDRLSINVMYYQANYIGITGVIALIACFYRPLFLLSLLSVVGLGIYIYQVRRLNNINIGGTLFNRKQINAAFATISALLCILFGGSTSVLALCISALVILVHSSFRVRPQKSRGLNYLGMMNGGKKNDDRGEEDDGEEGQEGSSELADAEAGLATPNLNTEQIQAEQAKFRQQFRANMRAKYLRKKD